MRAKKNKILIIGGCGYIGSRLYQYLISKEINVDTIDLEWFGNYINPDNIKKDYDRLTKKFYKNYDIIILLAGHSNYWMCNNSTLECYKNNVYKFINLLEKLDDQTFIYASSSGVYENSKTENSGEDCDIYSPASYYDLTKRDIDYYSQLSNKNSFGLRFGTLSGYSPNFRVDLMINRMYNNAVELGKIVIHNPELHRPVLGINDLCKAVYVIITTQKKAGIYNLASFNLRIREIAKKVAKSLGNVKIEINKNFTHYDYSITMSTKKFENEFNFQFEETVDSIVKSINAKYNKVNKTERK